MLMLKCSWLWSLLPNGSCITTLSTNHFCEDSTIICNTLAALVGSNTCWVKKLSCIRHSNFWFSTICHLIFVKIPHYNTVSSSLTAYSSTCFGRPPSWAANRLCTDTLSMSRHMATLNYLWSAATCLTRTRTVMYWLSVPAITDSANKFHFVGGNFN